MTLCVVWRTDRNICFASDSRLSFGSAFADAGIKVVRVPFNIYSVGDPGQPDPLHFSGDLDMAFAGSAAVAMMMKESLIEVVRNVQGIPRYQSLDMDGISELMFRGYEIISKSIGSAIFTDAGTCVVFAGYCVSKGTHRAFRMEVDKNNNHTINEVLKTAGAMEVFGSGETSFKLAIKISPTNEDIIDALQSVIDDPNEESVGGPVQYGEFTGIRFQPMGVAEIGTSARGVHYWRGPLDLNSPDFANGLLPLFPYLDRI